MVVLLRLSCLQAVTRLWHSVWLAAEAAFMGPAAFLRMSIVAEDAEDAGAKKTKQQRAGFDHLLL